jgi:oligopeptidase A
MLHADLNPLLDFTNLPRFQEIKPEHINPAINLLLKQAESVFVQISNDDSKTDWDNIVKALDDAHEPLSRAWGIVCHLHNVVDSPELREIYNQNLPKITEYWTRVSQDQNLYNKYKLLEASPTFTKLSPERQQVIQNALRNFKLGGAELSGSDRKHYAKVQKELAALSAKFSENVLDATQAFSLYIENETELTGLPEDVCLAAKQAAEKKQRSGWKFTLQFPSYLPVQQYAENRQLRQTMYEANAKRASEFGPYELNNAPLILSILHLRQEEARLLGYRHHADVSLVAKMAQNPEEVVTFLLDLAKRARPYAEQDLKEIKEFAASQLNLNNVEAWDMAFVSEKLRQAQYAFSDHEVKQYFPEPIVLKALFEITEKLFKVDIRSENTQTWHPEVRFFSVYKNNEPIAHFYLDAYAREHKRGGAWMDDARGRKVTPEGVQTPVAYLTCNFSPPIGDKPATLSHDDVLTLFHEFGHGLHHMLTVVNEPAISGIQGVEWDAVELPSQFMENFAWEWDVISKISAHVDTHAPIPRELFNKMLAAKNFQSGLQTLRQIEFALFDMRVHSDFKPTQEDDVLNLLEEVRNTVAVIKPPSYQRFPNSFSHIFAGGYSAGYYSYKWAEVLSADAYAYFEETGVLNSEAGEKFLKEILSVGGSRPTAVSFKQFRGRSPNINALLRHHGMNNPIQKSTDIPLETM